ncbi:MAG TPA: inorganic phosphate transporter [Verrucomicrobiae bacterium]|jgi:PiT family inorganic phosphate transporter|nr:inorganic phosphate transporter [Verrucomicrobiae bacterium]
MDLGLATLVLLALSFDFINGFHDAANSIATVVSTRVLTPRLAVFWAAFFNFIAFLVFELHVANTIGKGIVDPAIVDRHVIAATLIGASAWDLITWYWGLPTSSSHALIGGFVGSALVKAGVASLVLPGITKTVVFMVLAPLIGLVLGLLLGAMIYRVFQHQSPGSVDGAFRKGQLLSAAAYSLGHGGNDAQKTMGIIAVLLFSAGVLGPQFYVPLWVVLSCHAAMGLGTLFGGWRIVKTMGQKIVKLRPIDGFCAETGGAMTLFVTGMLGIPVSTTHTITGSIMGIGSLKRMTAVRWGVAGRIVWAWIFTIPASAAIAAISYWLASAIWPTIPLK